MSAKEEPKIGSYYSSAEKSQDVIPDNLRATSFSHNGTGTTVVFSADNPGVFPHAVHVTTRRRSNGALVGETTSSGATVGDALRGLGLATNQQIRRRFS